MGRYILRRLMHGLVVLAGVSVLVFALLHVSGDPVAVLLPLDTPPEEVARFRHQMGFDRPLPVQYLFFISRAVRGDFGYSYHYRTAALPLVLNRLPATLRLTGAALAFSVLVALPAGLAAALHERTPLDLSIRLAVLIGQSAPGFWLALLLIAVFAVRLGWFPVSGVRGWRSLVLPAVTVGSFSLAALARLLRAGLLDVLAQEYIRTARSKGLSPRQVMIHHALKNAAIPVVTMLGLQVGFLLGGAVIAEEVFAYPGMGRLLVSAVGHRDLPVIQAFVTVTATLIVLVNLAVDVAYGWLDPRIRQG